MSICTYKLLCHSSGLCSLPPWGIWPNTIYFLKCPLTVIQPLTRLWICQWQQLQIESHFQFIVHLWALKELRSSWTVWCSLVDKFKCDGRPAFKLCCSTERWAWMERRKAETRLKSWIKSCRWRGFTPPEDLHPLWAQLNPGAVVCACASESRHHLCSLGVSPLISVGFRSSWI